MVGHVVVPELAAIPFKVENALAKRIADVNTQYGPPAKRRKVESKADVFPKFMEGDLPAGIVEAASWSVDLPLGAAGPARATTVKIVQLQKNDGVMGTFIHNPGDARLVLPARAILTRAANAAVIV